MAAGWWKAPQLRTGALHHLFVLYLSSFTTGEYTRPCNHYYASKTLLKYLFITISQCNFQYNLCNIYDLTVLGEVVVTPESLVACAGETVTATCSVSDTTFLQWTPGDFFSESQLEVFLLTRQDLDSRPILSHHPVERHSLLS